MSRLSLSWNLYRVGTAAALIAALVFRRNMGAEIILFAGQSAPSTAAGWFALLQNNSLLGLGLLNVFDIVDYALVDVMLLAVYVALRRTNRSCLTVATVLGFAGIAVYFVTNTAFSIISLSSQYASAATDAQRSTLLAAGEAVLAKGDPGAIYEGLGGYISLFLLAAAGLLVSAIMFRNSIFGKATAYVRIAASALDLAYLAGLAFAPAVDVYLLSSFCMAAAGLLLMLWHLLIGLKLHKLSQTLKIKGGVDQ